MRKRGKTDSNQQSIVKALRMIPGVRVGITSSLGKGFPDLVVARGKNVFLVELKDGQKSASRKKLTKDEEKFKAEWEGCYYVCESLEEVLRAIGLQKAHECDATKSK